MQAMCTRLWSPTARFHPGQLAWSRHHGPVDPASPAPGEAISLWWDGDDVVGFGWAESTDWLELQLDPTHRHHDELAEEVIDWFEDWSDAPSQSLLLMADDPAEPAVRAAGFSPEPEDGPFFVHHLLDLAALPRRGDVPVAEGYTFRHVEPTEAGVRAACHVESWSDIGPSDIGPSEMTGEAYAQLMAQWPYRTDLDWVAVDASGRFVASALVWLDPALGVGLVEPVGCVPTHRRRGLAGAVTLAALHRLRDLGAHTALVTPRGDDAYAGPRRLYQALGFRPAGRTVTWTRSLE